MFLTAEGETSGLYVADRNETGFEVREQRGGDGEVPFSYRVVARRGDVDAGRLAAFDLPEIPPEPERVPSPACRATRATRATRLAARVAASAEISEGGRLGDHRRTCSPRRPRV